MDKDEIIKLHNNMSISEEYIPSPEKHMYNSRDKYHYDWSIRQFKENGVNTVLDIGCFDGWLDFLLIKEGFDVEGVELITSLSKAAERYAKLHGLKYKIHEGFFHELDIEKKYDAVVCYETLEHLPLELVPLYIQKMEGLTKGFIGISLPNQDHVYNKQHQWTPNEDLIKSLIKRDFIIEYKEYPNIPGNWFISYKI